MPGQRPLADYVNVCNAVDLLAQGRFTSSAS